jgi:nitroreductase
MATVTPPPATAPTRRSVLRALGAGGAVLAVAGFGGLSYRVYDTAVLAPFRGDAHAPWREWRKTPGPLGAVAAAVLAASPHNTQPWTFALSDDAIDLFVDPSRGTGAVDPLRREQFVGLGCALENLVRAAAVRGLGPAVTLMPDGPGADRVAHVDLTGGTPARDPLYDAIGDRHTNRGPYADRAVPPDVLASLVDPTGPPGPTVHWITETEPRAALGQLLVDAAAALIADDEQSRDSFVWFRGHDDDVQAHRDGLVLDGQGLSPLVLGVAKLLPPSSRADGDRFWLDQTRTVHTATAAGYGVVTAPNPDDRSTQLEAGRLLQRVHLAATTRGVALQHMNQITERIDREATTSATPTFAPRFAVLLPAGETPLLTFRVGYPERDAVPTPRRGVADVLR